MTMIAARVGVVAIGRNEGERLKACLASLAGMPLIAYVDSGSTDGSQQHARTVGVEVVELAVPPTFTAARARNAGLAALLTRVPTLELVQFIDGDCVVEPGWIAAGVAALDRDPGLAAVFGRRRERFPEASLYNRLLDIEWDVPIGPALSTGGDALFRVAAVKAVGGYAEDLIAGEEPDMCLRMRALGWRMERIDAPMTLHDAAITRLGQYWSRMKRGGHAAAEHVSRHGERANPGRRGELRRQKLWAIALPLLLLAGLIAGLAWRPLLLLPAALLALYAAQIVRLGARARPRLQGWGQALKAGALGVLASLAGLAGARLFARNRRRKQQATLIEYR